MNVTYTGTNPVFIKLVADLHTDPIVEAVATGRFRSKDIANRDRFPITAALLDCTMAPYSKKLRTWHHRVLLRALKAKCSCTRCSNCPLVDKYSAVELDFIDME